MLITFIGAVVMAVTAAGVFLIVGRVTGRRPPRWTLPAAAGATVICFIVWSDYSWFGRTAQQLPPSIEVAETFRDRQALRPWTLVWAPVVRFVALDKASLRVNETEPDYALATIYLLERYMPTMQATQIYDCARGRRFDLASVDELDEAGMPPDDAWTALDQEHPVATAVCRLRTTL